MTKPTEIAQIPKGISRRSILRGAAAAGLAAFAGSLGGRRATAANKLSHKAAKYQDTPKGGQQCSTCTNFLAPGSCKIVQDPISPHGWCKFYAPKS